jgi:hypothetical protein
MYTDVELTGLSRDNLGANGTWSLELLTNDLLADWSEHVPSDFSRAATQTQVGSTLSPEDLDLRQVNQFILSADQYSFLEKANDDNAAVGFRLDGPTGPDNSLFTWDGGGLDLKTGAHPVLNIIAVPGQFVVVTNTPRAENVFTEAARALTATNFATRFGTPTPFPRNYATATPIVYVTAQPTAANVETRVALAQYATAVALTTGTFTPTPSNWIVVTSVPPTWTHVPPTSTATPSAIPISTLIGTLTPVTTPTPVISVAQLLQTPIPDFLQDKILFSSDRFGKDAPPLVMTAEGNIVQGLTGGTFYTLALARESYSPDHTRRVTYRTDANGLQQIAILNLDSGALVPVTSFTKGVAYDAVWSPDGGHLAFVSTQTGTDEIYVYDLSSKGLRRITDSSGLGQPFNKRPSWSPDGQKIVFWSSRTGHAQIWIMNADGADIHILSASRFNDTDPVWVKP